MKSKLLLSILLVSAVATASEASQGTAKQEIRAPEKVSITPIFSTDEAAKTALRKAPELLVGSNVKGGCLYTVASRDSNLVLVPVAVNGKRICAARK